MNPQSVGCTSRRKRWMSLVLSFERSRTYLYDALTDVEGKGLSLLGSHPRARLVRLRGDVGFTEDVHGALISLRLSYCIEHVSDEGGRTRFAATALSPRSA